MTSSVKGQLFADAPVGAYCSGGVDSSLVVAIGSRLRKDLCIFHADVVGSCSEREAAAAVARHLSLELRAVEVHPQEFIDSIPKVIQHYGYPFSGHPNSVPFLKVSQLVAQNRVKGVLSGEGSDELFLGYPKYFPPLSKFVRSLPTLAMKKWRNARGRGDKIHARRLAAGSMVRALHHRFGNEEEIEAIEQLVKGRREGAIDQRNLLSLKSLSHHLRTLLHRNDCLGMAASVESRFPFLDTELVRFAVNLPYAMKIRFESRVNDPRHPFFVDKWIVRKLASRYLPRSLSERPKKGFTVRAQKKMKIAPALFRNGFVARVFELTRTQTDLLADRAAQDLLVRLMQLEVWSDVFFENAPLERIGEKLRRHLRVK